MQTSTGYVLELLVIIERQKDLLNQKDKLIEKLVIDNLEKENMINVLSCERA